MGILIGALLMVGATSGYAAVKQYLLTEASYPIYVDGTAYSDKEKPVLNYNGSTYVPLAKLGDITGVNYTWNESLKRVEIATGLTKGTATNSKPVTDPKALSTIDGKGKYAGYKQLQGYTDSDQYSIYFKGNAKSYSVKTEDLRGINLSEIITWKHDGKTYKTSKKDLHAFFVDTAKFKNFLGYTDYTFTDAWYSDTFGDVYTEWAKGFGYENEAARWVQKYFDQTNPSSGSITTLTPDTEFVPVDEPMKEPTIEEVIEGINKLTESQLSSEEREFLSTWISQNELKNKYSISASLSIESIDFYKIDRIFKIENVPSQLESEKVMTGNGIRYQYIDKDKVIYFNRADLKEQGII
jgi:hypothetical protein